MKSEVSNTPKIIQVFPGFNDSAKKALLLLCAFWCMVAIMEFAQDYISHTLGNGPFNLIDALSYKFFWLLFIPSTLAITKGLDKITPGTSGVLHYTCVGFLVIFITLLHLLVFSFFLQGISNMVHDNPWQLVYLIIQKLSSRLYISLTVNIALVGVYFWMRRKETAYQSRSEVGTKSITVKNGKKSVIIPTGQIKWISSEGPYLFIHTTGKKHIVTDSLKNIITTLPENFKRIHRSTIVNIEFIKELRSRMNGDYDVLLNDGDELRLSRNYSRPLKGLLL